MYIVFRLCNICKYIKNIKIFDKNIIFSPYQYISILFFYCDINCIHIK